MHVPYPIYFRNPANQSAVNAVESLASELAARFSPIVGCTRSWDSADPDFEVFMSQLSPIFLLNTAYYVR